MVDATMTIPREVTRDKCMDTIKRRMVGRRNVDVKQRKKQENIRYYWFFGGFKSHISRVSFSSPITICDLKIRYSTPDHKRRHANTYRPYGQPK